MKLSLRFSNAMPRKQVIARAIVCSMLLVLPSCGIPKFTQAEPAPYLPAGFNVPTNAESGPVSLQNSGKLGFEEFYNDPLLTDLIQQALVSNRELKVLEQEVQIAQNETLARSGAYLPFVTVGANAGVEKPSLFTPIGAVENQLEYLPGKHFPDPLPNIMGTLNFFWHPDIWRALRNARDAAQQRYLAAIEKRNFFVTRLIADIAENYYRLMALDKRLETLDVTIGLQEASLKVAIAKKAAGQGTELGVQRFQAEVRKNQSEKLIVTQEIVEVENRTNFLVNRYPQPVQRMSSADFFNLTIHALSVGVPSQLLQNRPDIRQAERELEAAGLDVKVARSHFFPDVNISGGVGYQSFNTKYLFTTPEALIYNVAGDLTAPLINKAAIKAEYRNANAMQLEAVYNYQRLILNAFTEVVTRVNMAENYRKSIEIKKQQLEALVSSVDVATKLFQNALAEYIEVLLALRDLQDARMVLIDTKQQQLTAVVNAYQALGGGGDLLPIPPPMPPGHHH